MNPILWLVDDGVSFILLEEALFTAERNRSIGSLKRPDKVKRTGAEIVVEAA